MIQRPKELTPVRRAVRVLVWALFGVILIVRFVFLRDERPTPFANGTRWNQQGPMGRRSPTPTPEPVAQVPDDLPRISISISAKDVAVLRRSAWNGWRGQPGAERPEVLVTVREKEMVYTNVALHIKGAAGSFRPFDDKPALTLNFGKHAPGQQFHGYSKLSLNNSVQDPTFLCEKLCRELFDQAGVPVPAADFATVLINGRDLGFYVLIEGYNKDFLRRYFKKVKGNLYDGGFCQEIDRNLNVNSGDHPEDRSDLDRLLQAVSDPDAGRRWERLRQALDTDRFITMLALEVMTCHWDGYGLNRNNYRVFHNLETDQMVFMPHGMDQMFDFPPQMHRFPVDASIQPAFKGLVARAVLSTPEGGRQYFERMRSLQGGAFDAEKLVARAQELAARIRPTLAAYGPNLAQWHDAAVVSLCDRITRRAQSVAAQLNAPREPLQFDPSGATRLTDWREHVPSQSSIVRFDTVEQDGKTLLHIAPQNRTGSASWRTRALLPSGRYRLEGRARVSPEAINSRVSLRASGASTVRGQLATGTNWMELSYRFPVEIYLSEVVLVCEFTGSRGEAWFDADSLRLVRESPASPESSSRPRPIRKLESLAE